jgi:hypothetical protein
LRRSAPLRDGQKNDATERASSVALFQDGAALLGATLLGMRPKREATCFK